MVEIVRVETTEGFDRLLAESASRPVFLFKHSLACGVSRRVREGFHAFRAAHPDEAAYALLDIQNARSVSAEIAERTGVRHESPQVILLRNGRAVWHASHWDIDERSLAKAFEIARAGETPGE